MSNNRFFSWLTTMLFGFMLAISSNIAEAEPQWRSTPNMSNTPHWSVPLEQKENWVRTSSPYVDVYASTQDEAVAHTLMRHAHTSIPRIAKQLGLSTGGAMQIYIAQSQTEFEAMQPHAPPDWADGTAWPKNGWIFLRTPRIRIGTTEPLTQVLDHEIVHILLGRAFAHYPVPRWLQEGVAQVIAGEYTPEKIALLGSFAEPMSFNELAKGFPKDRLRAQMAYAQSASVVAFLFREFGTQSLAILIKEMSQGHHLDVALVRATGLHPNELDAAWRGTTFQVPMWIRNLSVDSTLIAVVGIILLLGTMRKYKQYRSGFENWEEEERVHQQLVKEISSWDMTVQFH